MKPPLDWSGGERVLVDLQSNFLSKQLDEARLLDCHRASTVRPPLHNASSCFWPGQGGELSLERDLGFISSAEASPIKEENDGSWRL